MAALRVIEAIAAQARMRPGACARTLAALALALALAACGGNSTESKLIGDGLNGNTNGPEVSLSEPSGDNTTEIVVDQGPATGFGPSVANMAYVSVTVCEPGSTARCATIDHVFLDTGSIGLRVLRSAVAGLALPAEKLGSANAVECYPFVVGAVWGPVVRADLAIAGERAAALPIQIIDDASPASPPPTADCQAAANGGLMQTMGALQAKGVLGIGLMRHDCGLACQLGSYGGSVVLYYACDAAGACSPSAVPPASQVQHPVTFFATDNNGTLVVLPAVPDAGASRVRGRLVFGIGTQANNQLGAHTNVLHVDPDPAHDASYLYVSTTLAGTTFPTSYIDSGSNGLFFDDPLAMASCAGTGGSAGNWYCPSALAQRNAEITDVYGTRAPVAFAIGNASALFSTANVAFANLGGSPGSANPGAFVWGLPFFYGRTVYTAIWGQPLATGGPWYGF